MYELPIGTSEPKSSEFSLKEASLRYAGVTAGCLLHTCGSALRSPRPWTAEAIPVDGLFEQEEGGTRKPHRQ